MKAVAPILQAEVVRRPQELRALEPQWHDLWRRCAWATPFQSPHWLLPWWDHFGGGDLFAVTLILRGRLAGIAPMLIYEDSGERRMVMLGVGISDYLDAISDDDLRGVLTDAIWRAAIEYTHEWDVIDLQQLRAESPLLSAAMPAELSDHVEPQDVCPAITLTPEGSSGATAAIKRKLRKPRRNSGSVEPAYMRRRKT